MFRNILLCEWPLWEIQLQVVKITTPGHNIALHIPWNVAKDSEVETWDFQKEP